MLGQRLYITGNMYECVLLMDAEFGAGSRNERNAAAGHGLEADQRQTFLKTRQDEQIATSHEVGNVRPIPKNLNAGMS